MQETSETTVFTVFPAFSALLKNNKTTIKFASIFLSFLMLKSLKNQPENGMNFGTLPEPTFFQIFIGFWLQVGPQNRPKIHEKTEKKRKLSIKHRIKNLMKKPSVRQIRQIGGSALINSRGADAELKPHCPGAYHDVPATQRHVADIYIYIYIYVYIIYESSTFGSGTGPNGKI